MARNTLNRLEHLEAKQQGSSNSELCWLISTVDGHGAPEEILGWKGASQADDVYVLRLPGETESECANRAKSLARGNNSSRVPVLVAVTNADLHTGQEQAVTSMFPRR